MQQSKYLPYLEEYEGSGLSISEFCRRKGIKSSGFYWYYSRHGEKEEVISLSPAAGTKEDRAGMEVRITVGKMELMTSVSSAPELEMMLEAMENVQKRREA